MSGGQKSDHLLRNRTARRTRTRTEQRTGKVERTKTRTRTRRRTRLGSGNGRLSTMRTGYGTSQLRTKYSDTSPHTRFGHHFRANFRNCGNFIVDFRKFRRNFFWLLITELRTNPRRWLYILNKKLSLFLINFLSL